MTTFSESDATPADRVDDLPRILRAMRAAVREAVERHRRAGHPVAVWRHGRVEWIGPADLPPAEDEEQE